MEFNKVFVNVPYEEKENAKAKGARYDVISKRWYFNVPKQTETYKGYAVIQPSDNIPSFDVVMKHKLSIAKRDQPYDLASTDPRWQDPFSDDDTNIMQKQVIIKKQPTKTMVDHKRYLSVPFAYKDDVKKLGAKWDQDAKQWYTCQTNPNYQRLVDLYHSHNFYHTSEGTRFINVPKTEKQRNEDLASPDPRWQDQQRRYQLYYNDPASYSVNELGHE
jgi:hypothetical protein